MKEKLEVTVVNHRNNRDREYHLGMYISEMDFYTFRFPVKDSAISCSKIGHTAQNIARNIHQTTLFHYRYKSGLRVG
ncbi:MAG: hypothetical protein UU99_C0012G0005 [Parcubacteria group bacterium GW2011_GWE2_42_14]|nr:MAG: hypothetical protein UU99_C0012G0005 [Parcubacteria group bacterium GW2011_GWE2_42_14]